MTDEEFSGERNVAIEQLKNQEIKSMPIKFLKASGKGFFIDIIYGCYKNRAKYYTGYSEQFNTNVE